MRFVCNLLSKDLNCRIWSAMGVLPMPLEKFFNEAVGQLKTQRGVAELCLQLPRGTLLDVVLAQLRWYGSSEFVQFLGEDITSLQDRSRFLKDQDDQVNRALWNYNVHLASELAVTAFFLQGAAICFSALALASGSRGALGLV